MDCVFCKIVAGKAPADKRLTTEASITIVPLRPVVEGHLLVIPRQHAEFIWKLDPQNLANVMQDVARMALWAGFSNIIQSNGRDATQTIDHVHFHIVPRREGDGLKLPWRPHEEPL